MSKEEQTGISVVFVPVAAVLVLLGISAYFFWQAHLVDVKNRQRAMPTNSSLGQVIFTSKGSAVVTMSATDECSSYSLTALRVGENFRDEIKARNEVSGINGGYDPAQMQRHTENAKRIVEVARRCREYSDAELGLTSWDLSAVGLKEFRSKEEKP